MQADAWGVGVCGHGKNHVGEPRFRWWVNSVRRFAAYHLPEESFLYLLHAAAESTANAGRIVRSPDWRMYLMKPEDVEREILRLHQFRKLRYDVAGSLAQLQLPCRTSAEYAREMVA